MNPKIDIFEAQNEGFLAITSKWFEVRQPNINEPGENSNTLRMISMYLVFMDQVKRSLEKNHLKFRKNIA